mmetsp:Transcript_25894/g.71295  ORF Transcript_25894/g.71295 Transcript_25894/m.71295 type:complete len:192 (+) Transcript_25894:49-624(+)
MAFPGRLIQQSWHLVDAEGQTVGRLAGQIAQILRGKHKPTFLPNKDMGDHVVVINAEKVEFTGNKWKNKLYRWHTGYPGGLKQRTAKEMLERNPLKIMKKAILGMLRRNTLRHSFMEKRLFLYTGPNHPHTRELPPSTPALPPVPRKISHDFHFGLDSYAHPETFQREIRISRNRKKNRPYTRKYRNSPDF